MPAIQGSFNMLAAMNMLSFCGIFREFSKRCTIVLYSINVDFSIGNEFEFNDPLSCLVDNFYFYFIMNRPESAK